jgi:hypothetical protein
MLVLPGPHVGVIKSLTVISLGVLRLKANALRAKNLSVGIPIFAKSNVL